MPTTKKLQERLRDLGWKPLGNAQEAPDGSWALVAQNRAGHTIIALTDTREQAWSEAYLMAVRLTLEDRSEFVR